MLICQENYGKNRDFFLLCKRSLFALQADPFSATDKTSLRRRRCSVHQGVCRQSPVRKGALRKNHGGWSACRQNLPQRIEFYEARRVDQECASHIPAKTSAKSWGIGARRSKIRSFEDSFDVSRHRGGALAGSTLVARRNGCEKSDGVVGVTGSRRGAYATGPCTNQMTSDWHGSSEWSRRSAAAAPGRNERREPVRYSVTRSTKGMCPTTIRQSASV